MKVVFVQDVPNVAEAGEVKEVKRGHARNYLLPKGFAVLATAEELKRVEGLKRAAAKRREEQAAEVKGIAGTIDGVSLAFAKKVTSKGNIYGSVSSTAIQQELKRLGHSVEKSMIKLEEPLRQLGEHEVEVELTKEAVAKIKVIIEAAEEDKGEKQSDESAEEVTEEIATEEPDEPIAEAVEETVAEESEEPIAEATEETIIEEPKATATEETTEEESETKDE